MRRHWRRRAQKNAELLKSCAEFGHKAGQYDDVVQALHVADGGKYRADTIEALLHRLEQADELAAHVERIFGGDGMKIGLAPRQLLKRARKWREGK